VIRNAGWYWIFTGNISEVFTCKVMNWKKINLARILLQDGDRVSMNREKNLGQDDKLSQT
jgi:hypothetical protein